LERGGGDDWRTFDEKGIEWKKKRRVSHKRDFVKSAEVETELIERTGDDDQGPSYTRRESTKSHDREVGGKTNS